ncbi:MAG: gamma-glutamylcyclotransferase family protein [Pelistega sp.]|nr:gamma-glutamylcyclotransferase family protein [Pelistega sp.]
MLFPLFVYGTLKKGFPNYARHCSTAVSIESAWCWGRLYALDAGYPAMELPELSIQAVGTQEYKLDARHQGKVLNFDPPRGDWDMVQGELMYFKYPDQEIPPIDLLEDFEPGNPNNLYERVLITVKTEEGLVNAWTYMMKDGKQVGSRLSLNQEGVVEWRCSDTGYIGEAQTASSIL